MEPITPKKPHRARSKKQRVLTVTLSVLVAMAAVEICPMLPDNYKLGCTIIAKIIALLSGG